MTAKELVLLISASVALLLLKAEKSQAPSVTVCCPDWVECLTFSADRLEKRGNYWVFFQGEDMVATTPTHLRGCGVVAPYGLSPDTENPLESP